MFGAIFLVILAIIVIIGLGIGLFADDPDAKLWGWGTAIVTGVVTLILGLFMCIEVVGAGNVGIPVTFGETGAAKGPGAHFVAPWTDIKTMDLRTQELTFNNSGEEALGAITAQANNGGNLTVDVSLQYRLDKDEADEMYATVGTNYEEKLVIPAVRTCVRDVAPDYTAEDAYTSARNEFADAASDCVVEDLEPRGLIVEDVKFRDIDPGKTVKDAIDAKQKAEQDLKRRSIELQQANVDAEIERVAAQATYDAERIIACGGVLQGEGDEAKVVPNTEQCDQRQFTEAYLNWLYITTLGDIASSGNQTFAIVPPGQNLTPLIELDQNNGG